MQLLTPPATHGTSYASRLGASLRYAPILGFHRSDVRRGGITQHGPDVVSVYQRACDWAAGEVHAVVTVDHFLFALADREIGANALQAAGVTAVEELEVELLNNVHVMPVPALARGATPTPESALLAILNHALAEARRDGRSASDLSDVVAAMLDALRRSPQDSMEWRRSASAGRKRWPQAATVDEKRDLLLHIKDIRPGARVDQGVRRSAR